MNRVRQPHTLLVLGLNAEMGTLKLRTPQAKPAGLRFLKSRKRTKAVGPRGLKVEKTHESGRSLVLRTRPVRANVFY